MKEFIEITPKYGVYGEMIGICLKDYLEIDGSKSHKINSKHIILSDYIDKEYWKPIHIYQIDFKKQHKIKKGDFYIFYLDDIPELMLCYDEDEADRCNNHPSIKYDSFKILKTTDKTLMPICEFLDKNWMMDYISK